jgi:hypothetical protein
VVLAHDYSTLRCIDGLCYSNPCCEQSKRVYIDALFKMSSPLQRACERLHLVTHAHPSGDGLALACSGFLLALGVALLQAQTDSSVDAATLRGKQLCVLLEGQWEPTTNSVKLPFDIEINTNGMFTVAGGSERILADGQVIRKDGNLVDPSGAIQPVFDHVAMLGATVMVVRDGKAEALTETTTFANNLTISPDGSVIYPSGNRSRLADGQVFRLDGTSVPAKDSVSLKDGQVVVSRGGKLLPLGPTQYTGMSDGSKVQGDGTLTMPDGTVQSLAEGQTILFEGAAARN